MVDSLSTWVLRDSGRTADCFQARPGLKSHLLLDDFIFFADNLALFAEGRIFNYLPRASGRQN